MNGTIWHYMFNARGFSPTVKVWVKDGVAYIADSSMVEPTAVLEGQEMAISVDVPEAPSSDFPIVLRIDRVRI